MYYLFVLRYEKISLLSVTYFGDFRIKKFILYIKHIFSYSMLYKICTCK